MKLEIAFILGIIVAWAALASVNHRNPVMADRILLEKKTVPAATPPPWFEYHRTRLDEPARPVRRGD